MNARPVQRLFQQAGARREQGLPVTGHAAPVTEHATPVTGHATPVTEHAPPVTEHAAPVTGHATPVTEHAMPVTEHIQASISVLDASDEVARFVGPPADVRELCETTGRWRTFENELKAVLQRVHDANIVRHQRLRLLAAQAYLVGRQVARTPGNAGLLVHLDEVKRLRARRRRKAAALPEAAAPASSEVVREVTGQVIEELPLGAV